MENDTVDKYIGFSYAPDTPECESAAEQLYEMFDFVLPQEENEDDEPEDKEEDEDEDEFGEDDEDDEDDEDEEEDAE